jgi:hypothetical protein
MYCYSTLPTAYFCIHRPRIEIFCRSLASSPGVKIILKQEPAHSPANQQTPPSDSKSSPPPSFWPKRGVANSKLANPSALRRCARGLCFFIVACHPSSKPILAPGHLALPYNRLTSLRQRVHSIVTPPSNAFAPRPPPQTRHGLSGGTSAWPHGSRPGNYKPSPIQHFISFLRSPWLIFAFAQ